MDWRRDLGGAEVAGLSVAARQSRVDGKEFFRQARYGCPTDNRWPHDKGLGLGFNERV